MLHTKGPFPHFHDVFLERASRGMAKRAKAMRRHGTLGWRSGTPGEPEWLEVDFSTPGAPSIRVELNVGHRAHLHIRSGQAENRGKVLLRLENLRLVDNPGLLVDTFEWTSETLRRGGPSPDVSQLDAVGDKWSKISVRFAS
jgi:hypothetical protein